MKKIIINTIALLIFGLSTSFAQNLITWNLASAPGDQVGNSANFTAIGVTASGNTLTRGSGVTASAAADSINSTGWTTGTSVDLSDYYELTFAPSDGYTLDINTIFFAERRSGTGIGTFEIRSSLDNYAAAIAGTVTSIPDSTSTRDQSFTLGSSFDNITSTVTFRIYGYNSESGNGTWRLVNNSSASAIGFTGTATLITAVPEPHEYGIAMAALLGVAVVVRRRQKAITAG